MWALLTIPLLIRFLRAAPFSPSHPLPHIVLSGLFLPMCFFGSHLVLISILGSLSPPPPVSACGRYLRSQKDLPLKGDTHLWMVLRVHWGVPILRVCVHIHPILGRNTSLQLSNSEHVCFGVFLCIHTLSTAGLRVTRAALSGRQQRNSAG